MIGPKSPKPTAREEREAYETCTTRDRGRCVQCGASWNTERDHRQNRSQGGLTVITNLQILCRDHHEWKTRHPADALLTGLSVPGYARPEWWPAWRWDVGWVLYLAEPDHDGRLWTEITGATASLLTHGEVG